MDKFNMKKYSYLIILSCFAIISCSKDLDDISIDDDNQSGVTDPEIFELEFQGPDRIFYITGALDCTTDGSYSLDESNVLEDLEIPVDLPDFFDLSNLLPPIGNQGRQGSCVSWAITYYLKSFQERVESGQPYTDAMIMSPSYTYNQLTQGVCEGTSVLATLDILQNRGSISLTEFPYFDDSCNIQPTPLQNDEAAINKIRNYKFLSGINMVDEMKTLLVDQKPIIISAFLTSQFGVEDDLGLTAYREYAVDYDLKGGCHAMLVVGYSENNHAFKVVNSWGDDWGDGGFIWIDYAAFDNVSDPTANFRVISSAMVAYDL
jgi:C1A family cysteine protease